MSERKKGWLHKLLLVISYCAVICLTAKPMLKYVREFVVTLTVGTAVILVVPAKLMIIPKLRRPTWKQVLLAALFAIGFYFRFTAHWRSNSGLRPVIDRFGSLWPAMLTFLAVFGIAWSLLLQWKLTEEERRLFARLRGAAEKGEARLGRIPLRVFRYLLIWAMLSMEFFIMQFGVVDFPQGFFRIYLAYYLLNIAILLAVHLVLLLIVQRWRIAFLISSVVISVWGIANHYVQIFHGGPLFPSEFASAGTAAEVLSEYTVKARQIPWFVLAMVLVLLVTLRTLWVLDRCAAYSPLKRLPIRLGILVLTVAAAWAVTLGPGAINFFKGFTKTAVQRYGFFACAVQDTEHTVHPYAMPEGYDPASIPEAEVVKDDPSAAHPDVILILNETFCDLDDYTDLDTDREYLESFYGIPGAFYGKAVVPLVGGGTNNTEYELLTANSIRLLRATTPFNYVDFAEKTSNVVQYLKRLSYTTHAMHFQSGSNYNRVHAYPALGFDDMELGLRADLMDRENRHGNRTSLDSVYYRHLVDSYEALSADGPVFLYMLTFQNHGGYEMNDASYDTVHVGRDYGELNEEINEYLTSVAMSGDAFAELTEYFASVDRPVIVCMLGDHAPSFIDEIESTIPRSDDEKAIAERSVPYVVWSNYGADLSACPEITDVFGLMPELIHAAGLPLTSYYRTILDLKESFPVLASNGLYLTSDGEIGTYDAADPACDAIKRYYTMAYNAMIAGDDYSEDFYLPAS